MIAMIFEYWFDPDRPEIFEEYLGVSADLRPELDGVEGFLGLERYRSCSDESKYLTVGFFESEEAVAAWRQDPEHRRAQALGRGRLFADYRLRMAEVVRDYGPVDREQAPDDSRRTLEGLAP